MAHSSHPHQKCGLGLRNDIDDDEDTMRNFDEKNENDDSRGRKTKWEEKSNAHTRAHTRQTQWTKSYLSLLLCCGDDAVLKLMAFIFQMVCAGTGADAVVLHLPNFYNEIMFRFSYWASTRNRNTHSLTHSWKYISHACIKYVCLNTVVLYSSVSSCCEMMQSIKPKQRLNFSRTCVISVRQCTSSVCIWLKYYELKSLRSRFSHSLSRFILLLW